MPWSGSAPNQTFIRSTGTQTGPTAWQLEDAAGTRVVAAKFDTHDQDIAEAISATLKRDGGNKPSANIPMGGFRFTGVGDATTTDEYIAAQQVSEGGPEWYGNTSGTDTYTLSSIAFQPTAYTNGQVIRCRFTDANTVTNPTLNQDSKGAKTIVRADGSALAVGEITAGMVATLIYGSSADKLFLQGSTTAVRVQSDNTFTGSNTFDETVTLNHDIVTPLVTLSDGSTVSWDMSTGSAFKVTIAGNRTLDAPTGETEGQRGVLFIIQDGTGGRSVTFDAAYKFPNGVSEQPDRTANSTTKYAYYVRGSNDVVIKKIWSSGSNSIGFWKEYDLGTVSNNARADQSHGLGRYPSLVQLYIECTNSNLGYSAGDRVLIANNCDNASTSNGISAGFSTSAAWVVVGAQIYIHQKSSITQSFITSNNWKVILRVYE